MIFETLHESAQRGELLLIDGGFCHWHLRRDGQLTIREIISTRHGAGGEMLEILRQTPGAACIVAKCPADLAANAWYRRRGFTLDHDEQTKNGRRLHVWRLALIMSETTPAQQTDGNHDPEPAPSPERRPLSGQGQEAPSLFDPIP